MHYNSLNERTDLDVTGIIKRLHQMQLDIHWSYKGVTLTATGKKIVLEIIRYR